MKIEEVEKVAKNVMERTQDHASQIIFKGKEGYELIMLSFKSKEDKNKLLQDTRDKIKELNIDKYFVIIKTQSSKKINDTLDQSKFRQGLLVSEYKKDMNFTHIYNYILRDESNNVVWNGREVFTNKDENKTFHSALNFFVEDVLDEI